MEIPLSSCFPFYRQFFPILYVFCLACSLIDFPVKSYKLNNGQPAKFLLTCHEQNA